MNNLECITEKYLNNPINNNNQLSYYLVDMDIVDVPVLMIHACCINKQQTEKYFGIQNNWRNGLCTKRCANGLIG